jgi:hypothetical protein
MPLTSKGEVARVSDIFVRLCAAGMIVFADRWVRGNEEDARDVDLPDPGLRNLEIRVRAGVVLFDLELNDAAAVSAPSLVTRFHDWTACDSIKDFANAFVTHYDMIGEAPHSVPYTTAMFS